MLARVGALVLGLALLPTGVVQAQTPGVSPNPMAGDAMLGEQYCFDAPWTNSGSPGYGPYLRLMLPPELSFDSGTLFGTGLTVVSNQVFPAAPPVQLIDPLILAPASNVVTGTAGWRMVILEMPVGSVVTGGPDMTSSICVTSNNAPPNLANVGTPYPIQITPIYRYGNTPTGAAGSIVGAQVNPTVTPQVLILDKTNTAPESERPPGPAWPYDYVLSVDIANGALINPLTIGDTLPPNVQFVGPITITGGVGCSVTTSPSTSTPGGNVLVTCTGNTLGNLGGGDVVVSFPVYITDILNETTCDVQTQTNTARANSTYMPAGGGAGIALPEAIDTSIVSAEHVVVQKGANYDQRVPGDVVTYTLNLQTTEYGTTNALSVHDVMADGVDFTVGSAAISFNGGAPAGITPVYTPGVNDDLVFNVITAYGGNIPPATAIQITYTADVRQNYKVAPQPPVLANDPLSNNAEATFSLVEGALDCSDDTAATVLVDPVQIHKELLSTGPFVPGDYVIFRLSMEIPSGDTQNVVLTDYFPLPVFDVSTINTTYGGADVYRAVSPPALHADTMNLTPLTVTVNPATNALILSYPNVTTNAPQVVAVDVRVQVQPDAFADNLFLTNILRGTSNNTALESDVGETPVQIQVRAPALTMTKGVLSTVGAGTIAPLPSVLPVNGNLTGADAGDQVNFRLTIENTGGAPAFDVVVLDTPPAGLTGCTLTAAQLADGTPLTTSGNLFTAPGLTLIRGGNAANAVLDPNDGSVGAPFAADTAFVDVSCVVTNAASPGDSMDNSAQTTWKPQPIGTPGVQTFPPVADDASVGIRQVGLTKSIVATSEAASITPNVMIGEVVRYRLATRVPEGQITDMRVFDSLPTGLQFLNDNTARIAFVSNGAGLSSSTLVGVPTVNGSAAASATTPLSFGLPSAAIELGTGTLTCNPPGTFGSGTDVCFRLGNVSNADSDNDDEFIVIEFNALVLNIAGNTAGTNRNNNFRIGSGTSQLGNNSNNAQVTVRLPNVTVAKSVSPSTGVAAGDTVSYTLTLTNASGANVMPAYDVAVNDVLPSQLTLQLGTVTAASAGGASAFTNTSAGNTVAGTVATIPAGGSVTITYDATVLVAAAPGTSILNSVSGGWNSLPGLGTGGNGTLSTTPCPAPQATTPPGNQTCERLFSGTANAPIGVQEVTLAKVVSSTNQAFTGDGQVRPGVPDLAIGEFVTFDITATIPEGTTPQLVISDTLPYTNGVMRVQSGSVNSTGTGMTIATPNPLPAISDVQLLDGINDTISFDFGQIINPVGNGPQTIVVSVLAQLVNNVANATGDQLTNTAHVSFGTGLDGTATAEVDVVEPLLDIQKTGSITTGQAGDTVNFTVTVAHLPGSTAQAMELNIGDTLPTPNGLTNLTGVSAAVDPGCAAIPAPVVTDNSTVTALDVDVDFLPLGCSLTITYSATLEADVIVNTNVVNTANLAWLSTDTLEMGADPRSYTDSDTHSILISSPGMTKWVDSVSPSIGAGQVDPTLDDVSIGGVVTYQFDVELPAGDSLNAVVTDQLPINTVSMDVVSSRIVSVGSGIAGIAPTATPVAGPSGSPSDGADPDLHSDRVTWNLGNLRAQPVAAVDRTIRFEVAARVMDTAQTAGGVSVTNTASFTSSTITTPISATAEVDIVEPKLELAKAISLINGVLPDPAHIVQAGDVVSFTVTVSHQSPGSTADAFNVVVSDTLPSPGLAYVAGSAAGTCAATADDSAAPLITFSFNTLALGSSCTVTYNATVTNTVNPGATYQNSAQAAFDSHDNPLEPGVRHGTTNTDSDTITVLAPSLLKVVASTSLGDTAAGQYTGLEDLAIGENVTYTLTIGFPQGTTTTSVLIDTLPAGLEAVGASVGSFGNVGITTSLPGTPVLTDSGVGYNDTVTFDFGTITNPANAVLTDDWIQVSVTARVKDVSANSASDVLTNTATFSNGTSPDVQATADVELVEPVLTLTKTMTAGSTAGSAVVSLQLQNTGTAPAYDLVLEDVLLHSVWLNTSIALGTTPPGFSGALDTGTPGQTTVTFTSNTGVGLAPGASVTATFNASLAVFPPSPNPVTNTANVPGYGSVPDDPTNPDIRIHDPLNDGDTLGFPDPVVTKTVANTGSGAGGAFVPGDVVIFNVSVTNNGPVTLNAVTLTDVVPANTTFDAAGSNAGWTGCADGAAAGSTCSLGTFNVAASATETRAFAVQIDSPLAAGVTAVANQAVLSSPDVPTTVPSDDPSTPGEPDDPTDVPVVATPDLVLTKVDNLGGANAIPGGVLIYTLSYQNVGNQNATGVTLTETVPVNTTFYSASSTSGWTCTPNGNAGSTCTLSIGNVAAGAAAASVQFAVLINNPVSAGASAIQNTASVADDGTNGPDPTPPNNSDSETSPLDTAPGLHLNKTDGGISAVPGDVVAYVLSYWNDGNVDVASVSISETVPANTTFVPASSTAGWVCTPNNNAGSTCTLAVGTLAGNTPEASAASAVFAVQIDNPLLAGVNNVANTAVLIQPDPLIPDVPGSDTTPVNAAPDLAITKTAGAASVAPGDVLVYTLSYQNIGNQGATGVVITDTVPANTTFNATSSTAGWSCSNGAPAGSVCTFNVAGTVAAGVAAVNVLFAVNIPNPVPAGVESIANSATIADDGSNGADTNPTNNNDDVTTPVNAMPAMTVSKSDGGATVAPGGVINYVISYQNTGNQNASGVVLTEVVPQHTTYTGSGWNCVPNANAGSTCTMAIGNVAAGAAAATVNFAVTVVNPLPAGVTSILNRVTVVSDGAGGEPSTPPNPADPSDPRQDNEDTPVTAAPDLAIVKTSSSTAVAGGLVVYQLTYANLGNQAATGVVITETVPANSTFEAGSSSLGWVCVPDGNAGSTCTLAISGTVAGGQSLTPGTVVNFAVRIDEPLPSGVDSITNAVSIADDGSNGADTDPSNNDSGDVRPIDAAPDMEIVKVADRPIAGPGDTVIYTLTYRNVGTQDASGVVITEVVPLGTSFSAAGSSAGWSCADGSPAGTTCTLAVGNVAADGANHTVTFAVVLVGYGSILNTASVADDGSNGPDPTPPNNSSSVTVIGRPVFIPVNAPWALLLMALAMLALAWSRRGRPA